MSKGIYIFPECFGDTTLIEMLEYKKPSHQTSITKVLSALFDEKKAHQILVGIIDNDKKKPSTFHEFFPEKETPNLILKKHPARNHYLIVLKPALEKFLLATAEQANVDPARFGFKEEKYLKEICKSQHVATNQNFKQFINSIKQKQEHSCLKTLQSWLLELLGEEF